MERSENLKYSKNLNTPNYKTFYSCNQCRSVVSCGFAAVSYLLPPTTVPITTVKSFIVQAPVVDAIKLFFSAVAVSVRHFLPSLIFEVKRGAYPQSVEIHMDRLLWPVL